MSNAAPPREAMPRVLLVEDDDGVRRSLHLLLHGNGYDVRSYAAAGPLLADPTAGEARLLVADYRLPGPDGLDVRAALRETGWQGRSVLITSFATDALRRDALAAGYDVLLEKPLRPHELIAALA